MSKKFVATTKNGFKVYVDTEHSHAATHLQKHPELFEVMQKIVSEHQVSGDVVRFETDIGRVVGDTDLVVTSDGDEVFYAKRLNREKYTRFVRGRKAATTTFVTIDLRKKSASEYEVHTVYVGGVVPSFPLGKEDQNQENREFWKTHALIAENQDFLPETLTTEYPW